ncbi:hypothetical protein BN1182_AV_00510 [Pantoea ananatis]|nr:hypothetical protein BN1182_AV_00510 [Pantoea ananatis]
MAVFKDLSGKEITLPACSPAAGWPESDTQVFSFSEMYGSG